MPDNKRLEAVLAWGRLSPSDRAKRIREADLTPTTVATDPDAEYLSGPTDVIRMNRNLIALTTDAWPDANVRKREISKVILMAARKALLKRLDHTPAQ